MAESLPVPTQRNELDPTQSTPDWWSSIKPTTPELKRLLLAAASGGAMDADGLGSEEFDVWHIFAKYVDSQSISTGEIEQWTRTVLIAPDGKMVSFGSVGVRQSLSIIIGMFGPPPWVPPIKVKLVKERTRAGRTFFRLDLPAQESEPEKRSKKS